MDEEEDDNGDISIHALREEGDRVPGYRTHHHPISIHALREEGDPPGVELQAPRRGISIHALREEGDGMPLMMPAAVTNFYPRPPHGGRLTSTLLVISPAIFLSTPSSRRATCAHGPVSFSPIFLSTPSSRRATSVPMVRYRFRPYFYPRPPHGGRLTITGRYWQTSEFLSTPSSRRATRPAQKAADHPRISIHALREEGDAGPRVLLRSRPDFYPRPPRGGRRH